jgi:hypothetical protein
LQRLQRKTSDIKIEIYRVANMFHSTQESMTRGSAPHLAAAYFLGELQAALTSVSFLAAPHVFLFAVFLAAGFITESGMGRR